MKTFYIYHDANGIHETQDRQEALDKAEEPVIVKKVDADGVYYLGLI